jgi:hypothetical protein
MQEATQVGRIIIPTQKIPKPGGPNKQEAQVQEKLESQWHGIAILYCRKVDDLVDLRLFYEGHVAQDIKDEIAKRFGVGAVEWEICE